MTVSGKGQTMKSAERQGFEPQSPCKGKPLLWKLSAAEGQKNQSADLTEELVWIQTIGVKVPN